MAALCEEFENHQDGSGEPEILMSQSIVLGEVKAEDPLQNQNPRMIKLYASSTFNKLSRFHQKTE